MPRTTWTREALEDVLAAFVAERTDLSSKSFTTWWKQRGGPSSTSSISKYFGNKTFTTVITEFALERGNPTRSFKWPRCPAGHLHGTVEDAWEGTPAEFLSCKSCLRCEQLSAEREAAWAAYQAELPTFGQNHPDLVAQLVNPDDAGRKAAHPVLRCTTCEQSIANWTDEQVRPIRCSYCTATLGRPPGSLIRRRGGGQHVQRDRDIAAQLAALGLPVAVEHAVVVSRNIYVTPAIKPDIILLDPPTAIEIDLGSRDNRHHTAEGLADDQKRDSILTALGWATLRIRHPDAPTDGEWPIRIETTSQAPAQLARLIVLEIRK